MVRRRGKLLLRVGGQSAAELLAEQQDWGPRQPGAAWGGGTGVVSGRGSTGPSIGTNGKARWRWCECVYIIIIYFIFFSGRVYIMCIHGRCIGVTICVCECQHKCQPGWIPVSSIAPRGEQVSWLVDGITASVAGGL